MLLAAAVVGCGGSASFAERADAVCREEAKQVRRLPSPRGPRELRAFSERRAAIVERELHALARLDPPRPLQARLARLIRAVRDELAAAEELRVAGLSGDPEAAQGALYRGTRAAVRAARLAGDLGVARCGRPLSPV